MVGPCLTNNTMSGELELDSIPHLHKKNDLHSHSMGMMLNPAFNRGCSTRAAISLRNQTFVQGKQANRRAG